MSFSGCEEVVIPQVQITQRQDGAGCAIVAEGMPGLKVLTKGLWSGSA